MTVSFRFIFPVTGTTALWAVLDFQLHVHSAYPDENATMEGELTLCMLGNFSCFCRHLFKIIFSTNSFENTIRMSNGLDSDQDRHSGSWYGSKLIAAVITGLAQAWKVLDLESFLEKSLKIEPALKSTGNSLKSLEKSLNSTIFCRT